MRWIKWTGQPELTQLARAMLARAEKKKRLNSTAHGTQTHEQCTTKAKCKGNSSPQDRSFETVCPVPKILGVFRAPDQKSPIREEGAQTIGKRTSCMLSASGLSGFAWPRTTANSFWIIKTSKLNFCLQRKKTTDTTWNIRAAAFVREAST